MLGLYDLLAAGVPDGDVEAWLAGREVVGSPVELPRLSPRERLLLRDAWWFWARPGQHWRPGPEFITAHEGGRGSGKAVSIDTPLATPTGWTTMGEVRVGDRLFDEMGRPCSVTAVHDVDAREAWRVLFSRNSAVAEKNRRPYHVDACGDHLWVTLPMDGGRYDHRWAEGREPITTRRLVATLRDGHVIPMVGAHGHRVIVGAEPLPPQPMRCVSVDSPARMYLVGRGMIPTHNSWAARSAIYDAANDPARWGGHAVVAGAAPDQVDSDMLHGLSGIVSCGHALAEAGLVPRFVYNPSKLRIVFRDPRGGGTGLTVLIRASSNPKGGHGPNVGLAWFDEFGVWYHDKVDPAGKNLWRALRPAIRAGDPDSKVILTYTPSRAAEIRMMQADAERPECPTCRAAWLRRHGGRYTGEPLREPWRLLRSAQPRLHPLLGTRTTEVLRTCPACSGEVVAEVRTVFFDTRDNPHTDSKSRERAASDLATGRAEYRQQYAPRGEVDSTVEGALVRHDDVRQVAVDVGEDPGRGPLPDRWMLALSDLGVDEAVVAVDPAVTAKDGSDETGVVCSGLRRVGDREQVVALQEWSVRPDEVNGAPSLVWAPRAYWLALRWGARRIVVETNQGGEEVLSAVRDLVDRPPTEAEVMAELRGEHPDVPDARLAQLARRIAADARGIEVESVARVLDKTKRIEWYGRTAARGRQAVACLPWLEGARHWSTALAQITGYDVPSAGSPAKPRKDRGDAVVSAAQILMRVRETRGRVVDPADGPGWVGSIVRK